jgi:hypothetical protein
MVNTTVLKGVLKGIKPSKDAITKVVAVEDWRSADLIRTPHLIIRG